MEHLTRIEMKPGPWRITDPNWPVYKPSLDNGILTSDTFTGDGPLIGRTTDVALGGLPAVWAGAGAQGEWQTAGGRLVVGAGGTTMVGFPHTLTEYTVEVVIAEFSAAGTSVWLDAWRAGSPTTATAECIRLDVRDAGRLRFAYRTADGTVTYGDTITAAVGQKVRVRVAKGQVTGEVGGIAIPPLSHGSNLTATHYTGFSKLATSRAAFDSITVRAT